MRINVNFKETDNFNIRFAEEAAMNVDFGDYRIVPYVNPYPGEYSVNPASTSIVLNTKDYTMLDNLTINAAPVARAVVTGTLLELIGNFPVEPVV